MDRLEEAKRHFLGALARQELGDLEEAAALYRKAHALLPDRESVLVNLASVLCLLHQHQESMAFCEKALAINPGNADAWLTLSVCQHELLGANPALESLDKVLALQPDSFDALKNKGNILLATGRHAKAQACYEQAIRLKPSHAEGYYNLAICLKAQGRRTEALARYQSSLALDPDAPDVLTSLGNMLAELGRLKEAEASHRRALAMRPDFAEAHSNLGNTLKDLGQLGEAEDCYRRALEISPDFAMAHSNLLFFLNYTGRPASYCLEEARRYGRMVSAKVATPYGSWQCPRPATRLRVGLVSGDLRQHPVTYFLENVLAGMDSNLVELFAYPTHPEEDDFTARIKPRFAAWKPLFGLNDEAAARMIHEDGVHILVDLAGHSAHNRLPVFSWKPAPIQMSWLGYFATTGVAEMDYLLADPWTLPESEEAYFTETIWRLPETRLCFTAPEVNVPVSPLPARTNGYVTFGCFNTLAKMNDRVVAVWARILKAVPDSRLFLKAKQLNDLSVRQDVIERFAALDVPSDRLLLEGFAPRADYLAAYQRVDIALDPFPFTGGTTSAETLWMGVPVLTLAGNRFVSRQGVGLLMNAGLPEWIASDEADYIARAVAQAGDLHSLATLRTGLRQKVLESPIFDGPRFARHFQATLRDMWQEWCAR